MSRSRFLPVGLLALGLQLIPSAAPSQRPQRRLPEANFPELTTSGTIEDVGPGRFLVKSDADQTWLLQVMPAAKVSVKGTAKTDFLSPGQWVAFTGDVDLRRGAVAEKVTKLTVFTPSPKKQPGALPDQGFGNESPPAFGKPRKDDQAPKGLGEKPEKPLDEPEPKGRAARSSGRGKSSSGKNQAPQTRSLEIRGRITAIRKPTMTVFVPTPLFRSPLHVELADEPEIDVELSGIEACLLARKGDRLKARGQLVGEKVGRASEIEIDLIEPLSFAEAKKRAGRPGKSVDADDEQVSSPDDEKGRRPKKSGSRAKRGAADKPDEDKPAERKSPEE